MLTSTEQMIELHDAHSDALWAFALHLTGGNRARAEDVVQETLLRVWRSRRLRDGSVDRTRSWLFTIARHLVIDEWRTGRTWREVPAAQPPEPDSVAPLGDGLLEAWLVTDALAHLSTHHRQVLVLCFFGGFSVAEAAQELGVPVGTVKSRTHYALRSLRLVLEERGVTR